MATRTVTYVGQDTAGYDFIGNNRMRIELTADIDIEAAVAEIERCCGRLCNIYLYKESKEAADGHR